MVQGETPGPGSPLALAAPPAIGVPPRPDLLIHALAQLPDHVELALADDGPDAAALRMLAAAYGVESRIRPAPATAPRPDGPGGPGAAPSMAELLYSLHQGSESAGVRRGRDDLLAGQRIVIVTNLPTHYRVPLFNRLSRRLADAGAEFRVLFTAARPWSRRWMAPEPAAFAHEFLRSVRTPAGSADLPLSLEWRLRRFAPTVVVAPGFSPAVAVRAAIAARLSGASCGVWSGAIHETTSLRRRQRAALLRLADFGISYGHLSAEYLRALAPGLPVVYGRNTAPIPDELPRDGAPTTPVEILAVAQAIPRKALDVAVDAFARLRDAPCRLTVIGEGPQLAALEHRARDLDNVRFLGAVASDRTLRAYGDAEVFLFPTREDVFGLVLVEAMGAGVATVVSSAPGAVADLALADRNCVVIDGHDPVRWAAAIRALVDDPQRRRAMGRAARDTVLQRWTVDHAVDAMVAGLRLGVLARARRKEPR